MLISSVDFPGVGSVESVVGWFETAIAKCMDAESWEVKEKEIRCTRKPSA